MTRDELIQKMSEAGNRACGLPATTPSGEHYDENITFCTGALDVVLGEVRAKIINRISANCNLDYACTLKIANEVADHYAKVKTPSPKDRVRIQQNAHGKWDVFVDGIVTGSWDAEFTAEVYEAGVVSGFYAERNAKAGQQ